MILFHGTTERAAEAIEIEGFYAGPGTGDADATITGVFFADNEKHANMYGEVVIKVWIPDDVLEEHAHIGEGTGPYGDDEIVIDDEMVRAEVGIVEIMKLGQKYWAEMGY